MSLTRRQGSQASDAPPGCVWGLFLLLSLGPATRLGAAWGAWVPAQHAALRWEGRVRFDPDRSAVFDWASVRLHARFEGDAVAVYARLGQNYLDLDIDGRRVAVLGPKTSAPDLAWAGMGLTAQQSGGIPVYVCKGLSPGAHTLLLAKRTSPNFGPVTLLGLRFGSTEALPDPPPALKRRLEFIGDSLTNGYGTEGPGLKCQSLAPYENAERAWARRCAEALKAEAQILAYSGYGLVRNYGAADSRSKDPVPFYYPRRVLADPALWPREAFVPDLSVVFLGTNDYSTQPSPSDQVFEDAYAAFLDQVRDGRDGLKIILAYPADGSSFAKRVQAVVESQQSVGHWVEGLALPQPGESERGCDWHPKVSVQQQWADLASAKIRKMLHW